MLFRSSIAGNATLTSASEPDSPGEVSVALPAMLVVLMTKGLTLVTGSAMLFLSED